MGVNLRDLVEQHPATQADVAGKVVAIDLPNLAYAFYTAAASMGAKREDALQRMHVGIVRRVMDLCDLGARSVIICDGEPHPLKHALLEQRAQERKERGTDALTRDDYAPALAAVRALGVPIVDAAHDAEMQAASMALRGAVDVVASTDWDTLAMGAPVILRGLSGAPPPHGDGKWRIVRAADALRQMGATRNELCLAVVTMGCDYCPGLPGYGPKKALKASIKAGGEPLRAIGDGVPLHDMPEWPRALDLLLNPVAAPYELAWGPPVADKARDALAQIRMPDSDETRARIARLAILHDVRREGATEFSWG